MSSAVDELVLCQEDDPQQFSDDCLLEDYQNSSVLCCVQQLYARRSSQLSWAHDPPLRERIGRSWSSKVVDLGTNRKGVCDFLLVINSNVIPPLHCF